MEYRGFILMACTLLLPSALADPGPWDKWPTPPKWTAKPQMARYLTHYASWGVVSAMSPEYGQPFGAVQSFADGPIDHSTGVPYFLISVLSDTHKNLEYNNSASLALSMAESELCRADGQDPELPTCARLTLLGKIVPVPKGQELDFAKSSLMTRHPSMVDWPTSHDWNFFKMVISHVHLIDFFGGAAHIPLKDYYAASPTRTANTIN